MDDADAQALDRTDPLAEDRLLSDHALAAVALVLAALSLFGARLLNGSAYVPIQLRSMVIGRDEGVVLAGLVGVVLALVPVALGAFVRRRALESWPVRAAAVAMLLGLLSAILRLLSLLTMAASDEPYQGVFL